MKQQLLPTLGCSTHHLQSCSANERQSKSRGGGQRHQKQRQRDLQGHRTQRQSERWQKNNNLSLPQMNYKRSMGKNVRLPQNILKKVQELFESKRTFLWTKRSRKGIRRTQLGWKHCRKRWWALSLRECCIYGKGCVTWTVLDQHTWHKIPVDYYYIDSLFEKTDKGYVGSRKLLSKLKEKIIRFFKVSGMKNLPQQTLVKVFLFYPNHPLLFAWTKHLNYVLVMFNRPQTRWIPSVVFTC